jgi:pimeloyl-ACP methyl ester carboxylesterase
MKSSTNTAAAAQLSRRDFIAAGALVISPAALRAQGAPLDLAAWSYFWLGVERTQLGYGTAVNGRQMYVEYMIPAKIRHPYPIVLVHGGGGQGLDWLGTPDGRPGWAIYLVQEGYQVYLVDRPGHGRSPCHPDLHGPFPQNAPTYEQVGRQFTAPEKAAKPYGEQARLHTQWPGAGVAGDPTVDQVISGQGGSFLPDLETTHTVWRQRLSELFDKIGPAVIMTHSMGGPSGWIIGDARPNLVKGIIGVEPNGPPFGNLKWGLTASAVAYDPPVKQSSELKTVKVTPSAPGLDPYLLQAEPARKLTNLSGIPIALVTSEASYHTPYDAGSVAFLRQAGCAVEHIRLPDLGIRGNAHFMMMEKNSREVLRPILDWAAKTVEKNAAIPPVRSTQTALNLGGQGFFWVGAENKPMPYGTIVRGQMYVQYLVPSRVRFRYPIVLVHRNTGQMLPYLGPGNGMAGWAHYYAQEGYTVYLVDLPGHGRAPYHPDALGPVGTQPVYAEVAADFQGAPAGILDQFMAGQNAAPRDEPMAHALWASRGAELLDKIGPAVLQVHSTGAPFAWLAAEARPDVVKAIVNVEGKGAPNEPKSLQGIPIVYVSAGRSARTEGSAVVATLKRAGCDAEHLQLKDRGFFGSGHFMMLDNHRRQAFDAIRRRIEDRLPTKG